MGRNNNNNNNNNSEDNIELYRTVSTSSSGGLLQDLRGVLTLYVNIFTIQEQRICARKHLPAEGFCQRETSIDGWVLSERNISKPRDTFRGKHPPAEGFCQRETSPCGWILSERNISQPRDSVRVKHLPGEGFCQSETSPSRGILSEGNISQPRDTFRGKHLPAEEYCQTCEDYLSIVLQSRNIVFLAGKTQFLTLSNN